MEDLISIDSNLAEKEPLIPLLKPEEKVFPTENPIIFPSKVLDFSKNSEIPYKSMIEKSKLRQFTSSRTEIISYLETKTPAIKKSFDISAPMNSKIPFLPLLSIRTNALEEIYKEIKELKNNIHDIEEKNKVNSQCIEINKIKINNMEEKYLKLKQKSGICCSFEERKENLLNKLKILQINWKKSVSKLKETILEMEEEAKILTAKTDNIRGLVFRKAKEQRLLRRNIGEGNYENGHISCDMLNSSSGLRGLVNTPSWNNLLQQ